jgi:hypothetical protein
MSIALELLWERLSRVRALSFVGRGAAWNGKGIGSVIAETTSVGAITFSESGFWTPEMGRETRFHNVFRWSKVGDTLRLEHLRFGEENPVFLFNLAAAGEREWRSVSPHLCSEDCYAAVMQVLDEQIILQWQVTGPRKQEAIDYIYS